MVEQEGPSEKEMGLTREETKEKLNGIIEMLEDAREGLKELTGNENAEIVMPDVPDHPEFSGKKVSVLIDILKQALEQQEKRMN